MIEITIPATDGWDSRKEEFVEIEPACTIQLEHSLVSISKWEAKHHKFYFGKTEKTDAEIMDYIRCMLVKKVDPKVLKRLSVENVEQIKDYIEDKMTATTFREDTTKGAGRTVNGEQISSELLYYYMFSLNIPIDCQKWHINRLIALIRVFGVKNNPPKKMNKQDYAKWQSELNNARRAKLNTKG